MVPTARGAGTASTALGVRRDVCPATATQLVSRGSKYLCTEVHASSSLFFSSWQTVGVKRDFFFLLAYTGNVYWVVLWLKLSLDLTGDGAAGADGSPLQHFLLQMCSKVVVFFFFFFFTTVYVLPWTHPALKCSFKFLINKIMRVDISGSCSYWRMVESISSINFSCWVSKHCKYKLLKP